MMWGLAWGSAWGGAFGVMSSRQASGKGKKKIKRPRYYSDVAPVPEPVMAVMLSEPVPTPKPLADVSLPGRTLVAAPKARNKRLRRAAMVIAFLEAA